MKRKSIIVMTSGFPRTKNEGLNTFVYDYCKSLQKYYDVHVIAPFDKISLKEEEWDGLHIHRHRQSFFFRSGIAYGNGILPNIKRNPLLALTIPSYLFFQVRILAGIIKRENPDFVNCHWIIPQGTSLRLYLLFRKKSFKAIGTVHGSDFWKMGKWPLSLLRNFSFKPFDLLVSVNPALKNKLVEKYPEQDAIYLPVGIDTTAFTPEIRKNEQKSFNLLLVGNVIEEKGVRELVDSMPLILKEIPHAKLTIVGEGVLIEELRAKAESKGLSNSIEFTGVIPNFDLPNYYQNADLFCLPSYSEGYPIVLKEALSSGLNCLVSDLPVYKSESELNKILYFTPMKNSQLLASKVIEIFHDPNREKRKEVGRKFMQKTADWQILAAELKEEIEQLVK